MSSILNSAETHQIDRKNKSRDEFEQLCQYTQSALKEKKITIEQVARALREDASIIKDLFFYSYEKESLRSNKLSFLLKGAIRFINEQWNSITDGTLYQQVISWGDTSLMNYAQTALLEILSMIREDCKIPKIPELKNGRIYQDSESANIQSIESDQLDIKSRWVIDYPGDSEKLKLVIPHLGYWYGGSRGLSEYENKKFAARDCSSWVAELTGSRTAFSTVNILNVRKAEKISKGDLAAKKVLTPVDQPSSGDIFCIKGHCGIVREYQTPEEFSVLSYARMMPGFEGCLKQSYRCKNIKNLDENLDKWQIQLNNDGLPKKLIQSYYGLDNCEGAFNSSYKDAYFFRPVDMADIVSTIG